jgi:isoquinoline 1-oxidoreductase alpha subunit
MRITVNGRQQSIPEAWRGETLLDTLREHLGLVGAKYSCGIGLCGACLVHVDGAPVNSCTLRTADLEGRHVLTIEGLSRADGRLHPLQEAWIAERVPQCGFCQAGQLMRAAALLAESPRPSEPEITAALSGNLCRCGTYDRIKRAIRRASGQRPDPGAQADG